MFYLPFQNVYPWKHHEADIIFPGKKQIFEDFEKVQQTVNYYFAISQLVDQHLLQTTDNGKPKFFRLKNYVYNMKQTWHQIQGHFLNYHFSTFDNSIFKRTK